VTYLIFIFQASCAAALAYSCFCRIVRTDAETHREIRLAIWFQGVAAGFVGGAPILPILNPLIYWKPWTTPWFAWAVLLLSATLMQLVTAKYWRDGVPKSFVGDRS
jgi:hypothetical protein